MLLACTDSKLDPEAVPCCSEVDFAALMVAGRATINTIIHNAITRYFLFTINDPSRANALGLLVAKVQLPRRITLEFLSVEASMNQVLVD